MNFQFEQQPEHPVAVWQEQPFQQQQQEPGYFRAQRIASLTRILDRAIEVDDEVLSDSFKAAIKSEQENLSRKYSQTNSQNTRW